MEALGTAGNKEKWHRQVAILAPSYCLTWQARPAPRYTPKGTGARDPRKPSVGVLTTAFIRSHDEDQGWLS